MNFIPLDLQGAYPRYGVHTSVFAVIPEITYIQQGIKGRYESVI